MKEKVLDDIESLVDYVMNNFQDVLLTEGAEDVKNKEQDVIEEVVYGWGDPIFYNRRMEKGGIMDKANMDSYLEVSKNEVTLVVENDTKVSPATYDSDRNDRLDEIIEYGMGGDAPYSVPRKFTEETQKRVKDEQIIEKALRRNLDYIE